MLHNLILLTVFVSFSLSSSLVGATTLTDTLTKHFKTIDYPEKEVVAKITLQTDVPIVRGGKEGDAVLMAYKLQSKLVSTFKKGGWQADDQLQIDPINAGLIELKIEDGLNLDLKPRLQFKAFIHQCDMPMHKYRGEDLDEYFKKQVLEKAEECLTYDEKLQGKNYPY